MKFWPLVGIACMVMLSSCAFLASDNSWTVTSPNNIIRIVIELDASKNALGNIFYTVKHGAQTVVQRSPLGLELEDQSFSQNLFFQSIESKKINDSYTLLNGKKSECSNHGEEKAISFLNENGQKIVIIARAYNDGVAFRYSFPDADGDERIVAGELTGFHMPPGDAFIMPYDEPSKYLPAYENYYEKYEIGATSPKETGWAFPALFSVNNGGHYILISETALYGNYCGVRLKADATDGMYQVRFPEQGDGEGVGAVNPTITLPWQSPWRMLIISDTPGGIVESTLITDLADPQQMENAEWIQTGRAGWSWWSESDSPRNFNRQKDFINLAFEMGWEYYLVDANWNYEPTADLLDFIDYADKKKVGVLMWYNSGGPNNIVTEAPRDRLYTQERRRVEFKWLQDIGVKGIKVDFWQSDKQQMMQYYVDLLKDAYDFELLVNFHGCTIPRGWERTYPNFMTDEAVRGAECYKFAPEYPEKAPWHNVNLVFTRNAIGPMDYTPVTFSDMDYPRLTTNAHELALSVVFQSGITHFADKPESYIGQPQEVKDFLRDIPVTWDETRFISGAPGEYVVLARRKGTDWYLAGINGLTEIQSIELGLKDFGGSTAQLFSDAESRRFDIQSLNGDTQNIDLLPYGGFVLKISK
jgi:alpha-glucosidase